MGKYHLRKIIFIILFVLFFSSCTNNIKFKYLNQNERTLILEEAKLYEGIPYKWGGQSFYWEKNPYVDCSGFVINVYKGALKNSNKRLPFYDTTVKYLYFEYSTNTQNPQMGDLIFLSPDENNIPTHIGIFISEQNNIISFIDASSLPGIEKVSIRKYAKDNPIIVDIKKMNLR